MFTQALGGEGSRLVMLLSCSVRIFISGTDIGLINVAFGLPKRPENGCLRKM